MQDVPSWCIQRAEQCCFVQATGVEFPDVSDFWQGESFRSLGAGLRSKKFAFVPVKVRQHSLWQSQCAGSAVSMCSLPCGRKHVYVADALMC